MGIKRLNKALLAVLILGGLLVSTAMGVTLPESTLSSLVRENGPVEIASAALHFVVAAWLLALRLRVGRPFGMLALFATLLGLREMDMHNALTTDSITKSNFYLDDHVPLPEKLLVGAIVLVFLIATLRFVIAYWRPFLNALRRGHPAAVSLTVGVVMLPLLKVSDALPRLLLQHLGHRLQERTDILLLTVEETMEMVLPLVFLTALLSLYLMYRDAPAGITNRDRRSDGVRSG